MNFLLRIQWKQGHFLSLCQMELGNTGPFSARWICCCDVFIGLFCSYGKLRKKSLPLLLSPSIWECNVFHYFGLWTSQFFHVSPCFVKGFFALYSRRSTFYCPSHALITAPNKSIPPAMVGSWRRFFFSGLLGSFMEGVFQKRLFLLCQNATGESRSGLLFFFSAGDSARGGPFRCRSDSRWTVASRRGDRISVGQNTNSSALKIGLNAPKTKLYSIPIVTIHFQVETVSFRGG